MAEFIINQNSVFENTELKERHFLPIEYRYKSNRIGLNN